MVKIVAVGSYWGELIEKTKKAFGWILEIVLRSDHSSNFTVISKDLGVIKRGLVREMVFCIQASKDVKLSDIGRSLKENIPVRIKSRILNS